MKTKDKSNHMSMLLVTGVSALVVALLAVGCYFLKEWMEEDAIWKQLVEYRHAETADETMTNQTASTVLKLYEEDIVQFYYTKEETGKKEIDVIFLGTGFPEDEEDKALFMYQTAAIFLATIEDLENCNIYWGEELSAIDYYALLTLFDTLDWETSIYKQVAESGLLNYDEMLSLTLSKEEIEDELELANLYELSETKKQLKKLIKRQVPKIEMPEIED